jgi:glutamyl-tRNA reductase
MIERVDTVLVAGYGEMGCGIVASFARGGHRSLVMSRNLSKAVNVPDGQGFL